MNRVNERRSILPLRGEGAGANRARRPGEGAFPAQDVPAGLEHLLGMAAADPAFAEALVARRAEALQASGLTLSPAEQAVLDATPDAALTQLVQGVRHRLPDEDRRRFLAQAGAALLVLAGGSLAAGCEQQPSTNRSTSGGTSTASPSMERPGPTPRPVEVPGARPRPVSDVPPRRRVDPEIALTGILPNRGIGPTVFIGDGEVKGSLDKPTVRRTLRRRLAELKRCYRSTHLVSNPRGVDGGLGVRFVVRPSGRLARAKVTSNATGHEGFRKCVEQAMARWRFPKPADKKEVRVTWTFILTTPKKHNPRSP